MVNKRIVLLRSEGDSCDIMQNYLQQNYHLDHIIIEKKISSWVILKGRVKKIGVIKVIGQVLFQLLIVPALKLNSKKRTQELKSKFHFNNSNASNASILSVDSVNCSKTKNKLSDLNPDLIIVCGTRIIKNDIIKSTSAKFINIHAGITPKYRGVHGGYWALSNDDKQNFGVTLHEIDAGIDTGKIISQSTIEYTENDNFVTYPLLQLIAGLELLNQFLTEKNNTFVGGGVKNSRLYYHPTIWHYLSKLFSKGVK